MPFSSMARTGRSGTTSGWSQGAPVDPPVFLDTTALPGTLDYEFQFTMPGDPCAPLTTDITTYNNFVQGLAYAALGGGTWKVLGSTAAVNARDNTGTNPETDGENVSIFLVDGVTKIADNHADLWNSNLDHALNTDENGTAGLAGSVFNGSETNGSQRANGRVLGGSGESPPKVGTGNPGATGPHWMVNFNVSATSQNSVFAMSEPLTVVSIANNTFSHWIAGYPSVGGQDGFSDDPDLDRLANGLEAWFGTDPGSFDAGLADLASDGTITTFTHPQNPDAPVDITGFYEWSVNPDELGSTVYPALFPTHQLHPAARSRTGRRSAQHPPLPLRRPVLPACQPPVGTPKSIAGNTAGQLAEHGRFLRIKGAAVAAQQIVVPALGFSGAFLRPPWENSVGLARNQPPVVGANALLLVEGQLVGHIAVAPRQPLGANQRPTVRLKSRHLFLE